ncbi:MAG: helix-turn-helix transcriptional regulator [Verrucomicrobia bacterium]|nr:helix-turn-helix transcriptional regulator [Verrucomicrobiota bacterium]
MNAVGTLCLNLRNSRLARGWSQELMAELAGIPYRYLQDIEAQRRPGIRLATIEKLAKALGVEPWELLKPAQFPPPSNKRGKSAVG